MRGCAESVGVEHRLCSRSCTQGLVRFGEYAMYFDLVRMSVYPHLGEAVSFVVKVEVVVSETKIEFSMLLTNSLYEEIEILSYSSEVLVADRAYYHYRTFLWRVPPLPIRVNLHSPKQVIVCIRDRGMDGDYNGFRKSCAQSLKILHGGMP